MRKAPWCRVLSFFLVLWGLPTIPAFCAEPIQYDSGNRRDPFIPLVGPGGLMIKSFDSTDLTIEGIIYDPKQGSLVLINGEFYKKGDKIKNAEVTQIFNNRVVLMQEGDEITLWISEGGAEQGDLKYENIPDSESKSEQPHAKK